MRLKSHQRGQVYLACVSVVVGVLAGLYHGVPTSDLELHDGGVWVTNLDKRAAAHLNYPSMTLDSVVTATSPDFDVTQDANSVVLSDTGGGTATMVDTTVPELGQAAAVPPELDMLQGGQTVAVVDPVKGSIWTLPAAELGSFSVEQEPTLTKAAGARAAVGRDGVTYVVRPSGELTSLTRSGASWTTEKLGTFEGIEIDQFELTVVGSTPVLLDRVAGEVRTLEESIAVEDAAQLVLQEPGDSGSTVALASPVALVLVPLAGGTATVAPDGPTTAGTPASPVRNGECTYAAWGGSGHYQRVCDGSAASESADVERLMDAEFPVFRVNRNVVVLNNTDNGDTFLVNENMQLVANWDDVLGQLEDEKKKKDETDEVDLQFNPTRSARNHPPKANPDSYGIRPGRSTTLPVLDNDSDQDGDVLTATATGAPRVGEVLPVRGGEALQIVTPAGSVGTDTFGYEASDGRGESSKSQVQVEVHPWSVNSPPIPKDRSSVVVVGAGAEVKYNLIQDWIDPDGDPIYLESVKGTGDFSVQGREDGTVTVTDLNKAAPGLHQIAVRVSDGREVATGTLDIDLRGRENIAPVANSDHVIALIDQETTISPLVNDTDANSDEIRLAQVSNPGGGVKILLDPASGTFSFLAKRAGTIYVDYTISDGPAIARNIVRVDVVDGAASTEPPVADNDLALLPIGQSVLVPVLANDYDPTGGVLVVQSVRADPASRLQLDIVNHEFVRVRAIGSLRAPVAFTYTISNGMASSSAQVTVVNVPDAGSDKPPVVEDDTATVRAGDIVTVPALANDRSPANLELRLDQKLDMLPKNFPGTAFVSGRNVRFKAGKEPGRVRLTYTAFDSAENYSSGTIVVTIVAADAPNTPPTPRPLVARMLAGGAVTIPVPTDGVDPEGDSVTLLGVARPAPSKGVVTVVGGALLYVAPSTASGTDTFRYLVEDAQGAQASGSVRVGIAPASATNQLPTAVADVVKVRPSRDLAVPVTANDTDADGDVPILVPESVKAADKTTKTAASTDGAQVLLTTPNKSGDLNYYYKITDHPGGQTVDGVLTVQVREKAPLRAPIARDDVVTAGEVLGKNTATVDALANDSDPDGVPADLKLSSTDRGVSVADGKLEIALDKVRRVVLYTATDRDGLSSSAVVSLPGTEDLRPVIDPNAPEVKVVAGKRVKVSLADHVIVRAGRAPSLTFGDSVQAGPGGSAKALNQTEIEFTASADFAGPSAVTFEVTDGKNADDAAGTKATLSVPIRVLPATTKDPDDPDPDDPDKVKTPPTFVPTPVQVAAGGDAVTADLRSMVSDPDPGDMDRLKFTLGAVAGDQKNVKITLAGSTLRAEASSETPAGTSVLVTLRVTDTSTDPVQAQIPVNVVSSTRPLMQVRPVEITDAVAGKPVSVNIADYVTNPFAADGKPITVLNAEMAGGDASGRVTRSGTTVTITPDQGTHGQLTARFSVADATGDAARQVDGLIRITVRGRPDAPTSAVAVSHESRTATVTWSAPANNGAVITGYDVRWNGTTQACGQSTSCTVTGLKNAVEYTFTVTATNEVGTSEKSRASNAVKPDQRPDPPSTPSGEFGDKSVRLAWNRPTGDFSAVKSFSIRISPGDASGRTQINGITGTSAVVDNLVNGTAYTFQIVASNEHPEPSDPSPASAPIIPAGAPFAAAAPTVAKVAAGTTQPSAVVSWNAPNGNGDNNLVYTLKSSNGRTWGPLTATTQQVLMDSSTNEVTFTVRASNKAGDGESSAGSTPQRFFQKPGAVTGLKAEATGRDNQVKLDFGAASGNGATPSEMTYRWRVGAAQGTLPVGGGVLSSPVFGNGRDVSVEVWATSSVRGEAATGEATSASVNAYGPPTTPTASGSGAYRSATFSWNSSATGNGRPVTRTEINVGGGWETVAATGSRQVAVAPGGTGTISVRSYNQAGVGATATASAAAWADSDWMFTKTNSNVDVGGQIWKRVNLELWRFRPNSQVYCSAGGIDAPDWSRTFAVDGNGHWGAADSGAAAAPNFNVDRSYGQCEQR